MEVDKFFEFPKNDRKEHSFSNGNKETLKQVAIFFQGDIHSSYLHKMSKVGKSTSITYVVLKYLRLPSSHSECSTF